MTRNLGLSETVRPPHLYIHIYIYSNAYRAKNGVEYPIVITPLGRPV